MGKTKRIVTKVNGIKLFYRDTMSGSQAILCLHGKWGRGETWNDLTNRYQDRYRIIAPDQRGHGLSDKPIARYAAEDLAADIHELIQQIECGSVIVIGHSMGGRVAAYLAALYPQDVKALVMLDIGANGSEKLSDLAPDKIAGIDEFTSQWPTPYPTYEDALQDLRQRFPVPTSFRYFLESLAETVAGYDFLFSRYSMAAIGEYWQSWYHILPQIECPVLFVRAAASWCLSKEEANKMKPLIRHCSYFEVTNSDHAVYADNPEEFYPQLDRFLETIDSQ
jgi:pimeloyl-ACP methyl ester carboxylesterase